MRPPEMQEPQRVWQAPWLSFATLFYGFALVFGVIALVVAPFVLSSHQQGHAAGGTLFIIVGVAFIVQTLCFLIFPARRVESLGEGNFRFVSYRRTLTVARGEVRWIRSIWIDPNRLLPMWLRTYSGGILIAPRIENMEDLYDLLATYNPEANITQPTSIFGRTFR